MSFKKLQQSINFPTGNSGMLSLILFLFTTGLLIFSCNKEVNVATALPAVPPTVPTTAPTNKTFVVLGSSTAFGTGATATDSSWVGLLAAKFIKDSKPVKVINLAVNGYNTYYILPTNTPVASSKPGPDTLKNITKAMTLKPDFIIINLPSNDIANNYSDDEILANYGKIVSEITRVNVPYLITSTQPRNFPDLILRKRLQSFNVRLEAVYPKNVQNFYGVLANSEYLIKTNFDSGDGIHLNDAGHRTIFNELFRNKFLQEKAGY
jgi:lysophospholipase L1-like esterase